MNTLVWGVGLNDAGYVVKQKIDGKWRHCPFHQKWEKMLERGYNPRYQARNPTYINCTVAFEWLQFSNFKNWMLTQDWKGKQLDKDLLYPGNKHYSKETCIFIDHLTNTFMLECTASRGEWPVGVSWHKGINKFQAYCQNPFTRKKEYLGVFTCPNEAHERWRTRKNELAQELAKQQTDSRVAEALRHRYH